MRQPTGQGQPGRADVLVGRGQQAAGLVQHRPLPRRRRWGSAGPDPGRFPKDVQLAVAIRRARLQHPGLTVGEADDPHQFQVQRHPRVAVAELLRSAPGSPPRSRAGAAGALRVRPPARPRGLQRQVRPVQPAAQLGEQLDLVAGALRVEAATRPPAIREQGVDVRRAQGVGRLQRHARPRQVGQHPVEHPPAQGQRAFANRALAVVARADAVSHALGQPLPLDALLLDAKRVALRRRQGRPRWLPAAVGRGDRGPGVAEPGGHLAPGASRRPRARPARRRAPARVRRSVLHTGRWRTDGAGRG